MTRYLLFVILSVNLLSTKSWACDCDYGGPFLKMAPYTKLVALAKVTKFLSFNNIDGYKTPMSMEVEIIEIYKGVETRKIITVWGDPGHLCRPYLSSFKEGNYYLIAFSPGYPNNGHSNEKTTDYSISNCGSFWLTVDIEKKNAFGHINSIDRKSQTMDLATVKSELKSNNLKQ